jgi:hypothetical protein
MFIGKTITRPYRPVSGESIQIFEFLRQQRYQRGENRQRESLPRELSENKAAGSLTFRSDWDNWKNRDMRLQNGSNYVKKLQQSQTGISLGKTEEFVILNESTTKRFDSN